MDPAIVSALAGTSGLIGLLAFVSYFFYSYQVRKLEQSVRRTIGVDESASEYVHAEFSRISLCGKGGSQQKS
jgi:hypothetical protein